MVKNLAQLKRKLAKGAVFVIVEHCRPEAVGQKRKVNYADTTGIYTIHPDTPHSVSPAANGAKGIHLPWKKASSWEFREDGVCAQYAGNGEKTAKTLNIAFRILE